MNPASLLRVHFAGIFGQIDAAADNLDVVIYGLLGVAFLLAVLTIWYWRHTKPRPFIVNAVTNAGPPPAESVVASDDNSVLERALDDTFDPDSVWADAPAAPAAAVTTPAVGGTPGPDMAPPEPMSADEWLSITGPETATDAAVGRGSGETGDNAAT